MTSHSALNLKNLSLDAYEILPDTHGSGFL